MKICTAFLATYRNFRSRGNSVSTQVSNFALDFLCKKFNMPVVSYPSKVKCKAVFILKREKNIAETYNRLYSKRIRREIREALGIKPGK